jgi:hypothetical protein
VFDGVYFVAIVSTHNGMDPIKIIVTNLHSYRKIILCFWWKEYINGFLSKRLIPCRWLSDFNDVQLYEDEEIKKGNVSIKSK